eukprot:TRINITY_DN4229_c0_g1_i3.p1 TRINITY_DN4229_c0_g1~~TRINITY_DN4229_c0_g1_i3.p1  ORF type:complete len:448 (+),score=54.49 TRINITY_DN4229_c0_g1_i3:98-1441(+)
MCIRDRSGMGCATSAPPPPPPSGEPALELATAPPFDHGPFFHSFQSVIAPTDSLRESESTHISDTIQYALWLPNPKHASVEERKIPLIVYLHGAGGRDLRHEGLNKKFSMQRLWDEYPNPLTLFDGDPEDFPFAVMVPHCPTGYEWAKKLMSMHVCQTVMHVTEEHSIDISRIFVTGKSMGGEGSWKTAATCPRLFAACVPMCGGMYPYDGVGAKEQGHLITMPTWVFHAEPDGHVAIRESEIAVEAVKKVNSNVRFTRYETAPDVNGHDCWTRGYADRDMLAWLKEQRNTELVESGLEWARTQMNELLVHRCATNIQRKALADPFKFKKGLERAWVTKLRKPKVKAIVEVSPETAVNKEVTPTETPTATEAPTVTQAPTEAPSDTPQAPTEAPTEEPSEAPAEAPMEAPSEVSESTAPSEVPTEVFSKDLTEAAPTEAGGNGEVSN